MAVDHIEKTVNVAAQISAKAEKVLDGMEFEMNFMKWPNDFRAIMWEAIADAANIRARQARNGDQ